MEVRTHISTYVKDNGFIHLSIALIDDSSVIATSDHNLSVAKVVEVIEELEACLRELTLGQEQEWSDTHHRITERVEAIESLLA